MSADTITRHVPVACACGDDLTYTRQQLDREHRLVTLECDRCGEVVFDQLQQLEVVRAMFRGRSVVVGSFWREVD